MDDLYFYQQDSPKDWIQILVQDPSDLDQHQHPKTVYRVQLFLADYFSRLVKAKLVKPLSTMLDEQIIALHLEFEDCIPPGQAYHLILPYALNNLGLTHPTFTAYNCSICAGGLNLDFCHGCDRRFKDDLQRVAWPATLPDKVIQLLLDMGHEFKQDPQKAFKKEKASAEFPIFGLGGKDDHQIAHTR